MEELHYDFNTRAGLPYILAGMAAFILVLSFISDMDLLIWATFPLIALGLILDHIYQKELDRKARDEILKGDRIR